MGRSWWVGHKSPQLTSWCWMLMAVFASGVNAWMKSSKPPKKDWSRKMPCARNCLRGKSLMICTVCAMLWKGIKMTNQNEPMHDIAHLAHVELLTPKPEESLQFFMDVMGMTESGRQGDSVYLRGWDDYEHHSLQLTASPQAGLGHMAFRARSQQALER